MVGVFVGFSLAWRVTFAVRGGDINVGVCDFHL
jgi:hypothetical protein